MELVYEGAPLTLEPKLEFIKRKGEERAAREAAAPAAEGGSAAGAGAGAAPASRKRRAEGEPGGDDEGEEAGGEGAAAEAAAEEEEPDLGDYEPGCVLHFDFGDAEFAEAPTFGLVKDTFGGRKEGGVQFVEYSQVGFRSGSQGLRGWIGFHVLPMLVLLCWARRKRSGQKAGGSTAGR